MQRGRPSKYPTYSRFEPLPELGALLGVHFANKFETWHAKSQTECADWKKLKAKNWKNLSLGRLLRFGLLNVGGVRLVMRAWAVLEKNGKSIQDEKEHKRILNQINSWNYFDAKLVHNANPQQAIVDKVVAIWDKLLADSELEAALITATNKERGQSTSQTRRKNYLSYADIAGELRYARPDIFGALPSDKAVIEFFMRPLGLRMDSNYISPKDAALVRAYRSEISANIKNDHKALISAGHFAFLLRQLTHYTFQPRKMSHLDIAIKLKQALPAVFDDSLNVEDVIALFLQPKFMRADKRYISDKTALDINRARELMKASVDNRALTITHDTFDVILDALPFCSMLGQPSEITKNNGILPTELYKPLQCVLPKNCKCFPGVAHMLTALKKIGDFPPAKAICEAHRRLTHDNSHAVMEQRYYSFIHLAKRKVYSKDLLDAICIATLAQQALKMPVERRAHCSVALQYCYSNYVPHEKAEQRRAAALAAATPFCFRYGL